MDSFVNLDGSKSSSNGSVSDMTGITDMLRKKRYLKPSAVAFSGETRYLTPLWVFENGESRQELHRSGSSQSTIFGFEPKCKTVDPHYQITQDRIKATLKLLTFREPRVLVQFWSPCVVGKQTLLATFDQPFGLGVIDEGLCLYRQDSEHNPFVVEKDNEEEDHSPLARVFRRGIPVWTSDITNYLSTNFPQQECAIRCNLHGYLALPVFNSTTGLCVGVLELLMSSKYTSYVYEVQQVHNTMKTVDLITPQELDRPYLNVQNEHGENLMNIIFSSLKVVCGTHNLPLAQTWAMSPLSSFASHKQLIMKSCNSFSTKCLEKVCMSTTGLPFHVQDLKMWSFRRACRDQHLDKSSGYIGRALLSKGSVFCEDVTKLGEEEYPLVYNARMSRLTSCFAVFLYNVECNSDYILEFFLQDTKCVPNVVQTLKQNFEAADGFELGEISAIQVVGPSDPHSIQMYSTTTTKLQTESLIIPQVVGPHMDLSLNIEPDTVSISTSCMDDNFMFQTDSSSSDSISSIATTCLTITDTREVKQGRKRKIDSDSVHLMVEKKATFDRFVTKFPSSSPMLLSDLQSEVAKRFNLQGKEFKLQYIDEDNDLIWITCDVDLKLALENSVISNNINLICESD